MTSTSLHPVTATRLLITTRNRRVTMPHGTCPALHPGTAVRHQMTALTALKQYFYLRPWNFGTCTSHPMHEHHHSHNQPLTRRCHPRIRTLKRTCGRRAWATAVNGSNGCYHMQSRAHHVVSNFIHLHLTTIITRCGSVKCRLPKENIRRGPMAGSNDSTWTLAFCKLQRLTTLASTHQRTGSLHRSRLLFLPFSGRRMHKTHVGVPL